MKITTLSIWLLLAHNALADNVIADVCSKLQGIWNCKATFDVPTGAKAKMCPNKFFKTDNCKTKATYRYPCPTWSKPGRMCTGWTCVPGTYETWIDVPCGIDIMTTRVDMCQAVRGALGNAGQQFITKAGAMCECLPKVLDMITTTAFESVKTGADLSAAVSNVVGDLVELQKCMIDNGFQIKDDKAEVMAGDLSTEGGWVVVQAAEIDLETYGKLAAALSPCFIATCEPDLIRSFFTNYLTESKGIMSDQLTKVLESWINVFEQVEDRLLAVLYASRTLTAHAKTVPSKIEGIEEKVCKKKACLGPVISDFMKKVSEAVATTQAFADVQDGAQEVVDVAPRLVNLTRSAIEVTGSIPDVDYFIQLIISGKLRKIEDMLDVIQITKELPKVANELQDAVGPILELVSKFNGSGEKALALVQKVLSSAWESYPLEFTTDSSGNVRDGVKEIQELIRNDLELPFRNVTDSLAALDDVFTNFPIKKGQFNFHAGVSSYRRWSTVSMDLPCTRKKTAHYEVAGGFKGSFDYPEIYGCPYGPKEVPWPNHHIPYFKFRMA